MSSSPVTSDVNLSQQQQKATQNRECAEGAEYGQRETGLT